MKNKLIITSWAEEDRPREKMLLKGISVLSDAELIAILIGSGNKEETAVQLAQRILFSVGNDLNSLAKLEIPELINKFKGIGEAKAIAIKAALELSRRRKISELPVFPQIRSSWDAFQILHPIISDLNHEEIWILLLNKANKMFKKIQLSKGGLSSTIFDIRLIMKAAIENSASSFIISHNHPSGDHSPSKDDNHITNKLKDAGLLLDIHLIDHIIIANKTYFSYKDNKLL